MTYVHHVVSLRVSLLEVNQAFSVVPTGMLLGHGSSLDNNWQHLRA